MKIVIAVIVSTSHCGVVIRYNASENYGVVSCFWSWSWAAARQGGRAGRHNLGDERRVRQHVLPEERPWFMEPRRAERFVTPL